MWKELLGDYKIILGSKSPRRQQLLKALDIPFEVITLDTDETYPPDLDVIKIPQWIARKKADAFESIMQPDWIVITADTIVALEDKVIGKPHTPERAREYLRLLSGKKHLVITGVAIKTAEKTTAISCKTSVWFKNLTDDEIDYYVDVYQPLDKAGAYGIQEWIGYVGIKKIEGSYYNVVGLPIQKLYTILRKTLEKLNTK